MRPASRSGGASDAAREALRSRPRRWLVTGSAGFIGSHLVEALLDLGQDVVGLDNFATGHRRNLDQVRTAVGADAWRRHAFIEADITDLAACRDACRAVDVVLHEAALGSVPRSIEDPLRTHAANATGFLNMLVAARDAGVRRFVYAASSSTYGDHPGLPKVESVIGAPLSPYAVTKYVNELYAQVFGRCYGMATIGLRYFNVFGPRQDPKSEYAAVIPKFITAALAGKQPRIFGDGQQSRDFCHIDNVVEANFKAITSDARDVSGGVFNIACGVATDLNEVVSQIGAVLGRNIEARHEPGRAGDIKHSVADISAARRRLGYTASVSFAEGLRRTIEWYRTTR